MLKKRPLTQSAETIEKEQTEEEKFSKVVTCDCGKKFVKTCPSKDVCHISLVKCPGCGALCN